MCRWPSDSTGLFHLTAQLHGHCRYLTDHLDIGWITEHLRGAARCWVWLEDECVIVERAPTAHVPVPVFTEINGSLQFMRPRRIVYGPDGVVYNDERAW